MNTDGSPISTPIQMQAIYKGLTCIAATILLFSLAKGSALDEGAQTKSREAAENQQIKVKTELMEVRTTVTDRKGHFVENLKKDDFELLEDNKPQEVSFFSISQVESLGNRPPAATPIPGAPPNKTVEPVKRALERRSEPPVRTTLLYVDNLHLTFSNLNWVKQALRRFIKERVTDQDLIALVTSSGTLGIAEQFTRNRQLLSYAIEQIRLGPGRSGSESFYTPLLAAQVMAGQDEAKRQAHDIIRSEQHCKDCICQVLRDSSRIKAQTILYENSYSRKTTLAILKGFAEQMAGLPGKRMIVVFSDGFSMMDNDGGVHNEDLQPAINHAVRSGVVIYSIDSKGLQGLPTIDAGRNHAPSNAEQSPNDRTWGPDCDPHHPGTLDSFVSMSEQEELNGIATIANDTGGKMYTNTNDFVDSLGQAFDANRFYYVLSYYMQPGGDANRFRTIKVHVRNHPEYTVRTVKGFLPADLALKKEEDAGKTPQQRLLQAMKSPLAVTDLGVSAQADYMETATDDKQVSLTVFFPGDRFHYREQDQRHVVGLEILYAIYDSSGKQVDAISARVEGRLTAERLEQAKTVGYRFSRRLTLKPGVYQARLGVREEGTNRMGTASVWVEVPELNHEKMEMSSLMFQNPFEIDPATEEGINVSELEQVQTVQGIPLYGRGDVCNYFFRVNSGTKTSAESVLVWMKELFQDGKPVKQEPWRPITAEEKKNTDKKGWFDVEDEMDFSGFDPGIYELRVSVKDERSSKTLQRTAVFGVE